MQSQQQSMQFWLSQSNGQVPQIPSHISDGEETDPLHINEADAPVNPIIARQQTKKREHTAPKVLLSSLHKIMYWESNTSQLFKDLLSQANKRQNNSTPIKFYLLAVKANLLKRLKERFAAAAQAKLKNYATKRKWSARRFLLIRSYRLETAREWKERIEKALDQKSEKNAFEVIWEGNNHPGKYKESQVSVASFKKKISKKRKSQFVLKSSSRSSSL